MTTPDDDRCGDWRCVRWDGRERMWEPPEEMGASMAGVHWSTRSSEVNALFTPNVRDQVLRGRIPEGCGAGAPGATRSKGPRPADREMNGYKRVDRGAIDLETECRNACACSCATRSRGTAPPRDDACDGTVASECGSPQRRWEPRWLREMNGYKTVSATLVGTRIVGALMHHGMSSCIVGTITAVPIGSSPTCSVMISA